MLGSARKIESRAVTELGIEFKPYRQALEGLDYYSHAHDIMRMHVCICIRIRIRMCIRMSMSMCTCMCMCMHVHVIVNVNVNMFICSRASPIY